MNKKDDLIGKRFGRLIVVDVDEENKKPGCGRSCKCVCDCGKTTEKWEHVLRRGSAKSCGCLSAECASQRIKERCVRNGWTDPDLMRKWRTMNYRCYNAKTKGYEDYGGRGIKVCNEWRNSFQLFKEWSIKNGYKHGLSLDRIDVNGDYEPNNCRWVEWRLQARNKRNTVYLTAFGETKPFTEWLETCATGMSEFTIRSRIKRGWSAEEALTTPPKREYVGNTRR